MKVEIKTQYLVDDPKRPIHLGEVIRDPLCRGQVGWLDWCNEEGSRPNIPTARLEILGSKYEIQVEKTSRTHELKLGTKLFTWLAEHLRDLGYVDLIIIGALDSALPFYQHALDELIETNVVANYQTILGPSRNTIDNHDLRVIFRPKP